MKNKKLIINRLKNLVDIKGVTVEVSEELGTIYVKYGTICSLDFKFSWSEDHFIGHFIDKNGIKSQAVISLKKPIDAIHFVTAYSLLTDLRARQKKQ